MKICIKAIVFHMHIYSEYIMNQKNYTFRLSEPFSTFVSALLISYSEGITCSISIPITWRKIRKCEPVGGMYIDSKARLNACHLYLQGTEREERNVSSLSIVSLPFNSFFVLITGSLLAWILWLPNPSVVISNLLVNLRVISGFFVV